MSERESQIQRDVGVDVSAGIDDPTEEAADDGGGISGWLRNKLGTLGSSRGLIVSLVLTLGGALLLGGLLPLGMVGNALGIFVAAFLYGTVASEHRYLEMSLAGGLVAGVWAFLGNLVLTLVGPGIPVVIVGALLGVLVAATGHYFGRDLRKGLTEDLDAEPGP
ncbi:hypothetical protein BRC61_07950 [Halobacteriales archaeon QH_10_65_19]|jgi:hypothetical protein|nr:MAG: hypothetical protein BRC61_07950 [Halobacteriales archaeon QH_10_65_19]